MIEALQTITFMDLEDREDHLGMELPIPLKLCCALSRFEDQSQWGSLW